MAVCGYRTQATIDDLSQTVALLRSPVSARQDRGFEAVYADVRTKVLDMEERNVFCGEYNVAVLLDRLVSLAFHSRMTPGNVL